MNLDQKVKEIIERAINNKQIFLSFLENLEISGDKSINDYI